MVTSFMGIMGDYVEDCTLIESRREPDGEGGWNTTWYDSAPFKAAIVHENDVQARLAESQGMKATYTVTTPKGMPLEYHDVFRRERDGQLFRVTSRGEDEVTPKTATFEVSQVSAEEWRIP